uniref:Uncharacterized protein n=1 Tax=Lotharella globosa TaxID=91324 RepID=A0A7S3Z8Z4_9EUKA
MGDSSSPKKRFVGSCLWHVGQAVAYMGLGVTNVSHATASACRDTTTTLNASARRAIAHVDRTDTLYPLASLGVQAKINTALVCINLGRGAISVGAAGLKVARSGVTLSHVGHELLNNGDWPRVSLSRRRKN